MGETTTVHRRSRPLGPYQVALAAMVGTAIEFYDYVLYAFLAATVFAPLFFPQLVPWLATMVVLAGHAVAIVVRPLGAVVFGRVGDRVSRRLALVGSLGLMGVATVGIGVLPTHAAIGAAAAVLLVLLRLLQGLAIGGEYPGAVVVAVEHARPARRTFLGSFSQLGTVLGLLLAGLSLLAVTLAAGEETLRAWAWRLPFLASGVLVVIGLVLRARLADTPEFVAADRSRAGRLGTVLRQCRRPLGAVTLMWTGPATLGYGFIIGLFAYVELYVPALQVLDVQVGLVLTTVLVASVTVASGWFGDRWGAHRTVLVSGLWACAWAVPGYLLVGTGSAPALWVAMAVGGASFGLFGGVAPAMVAQAFPVDVRYLGVGVALAVSAVLGGAVLPLPALALVGVSGGSPVPLMALVAAGGAATVAGVLLLRRSPR